MKKVSNRARRLRDCWLILDIPLVNSDWFKGHLESNPSKVGFFPSNYVQKTSGGFNSAPPNPRFVAPPSQQNNSFAPPNQNSNQQQYQQPAQQPYAPPPPAGYNPYPNQQYQNSYASLPPPQGSHDQLALAAVPYTQGAMTTTVVTPGGNNAVVTDTETGKKNRFKLKPGGMGSTVSIHPSYNTVITDISCLSPIACT
jgi:hypothetical protein